MIESLVLWGFPIVMLLVTLGYYFYWGKEAEERNPDAGTASSNRGDL